MTNHNPYVGPCAFEAADRDNFFGREPEIRQLESLAVARRVVLIYSPSGAGKTSLLNAGLVPRLEALRGTTVLPIARVGGAAPPGRCGENGNVYTASALLDLLEEEGEGGELAGLTLEAGLAKRLAREPEKTRRRPHFLVFDQFEELFTTHADHYPERAGFLEQVRDALASHSQITLVLAMREDYIAHLDVFRTLLPDHLRTRFRLDLLSEKAALAAVVEPARQAGVTFRDNAGRALVDDLRTMRVQAVDGATCEQLGPCVDPVQLQVVCRRLWDRRPGEASEIDMAQLEALGSVDRALAEYYAEQVAAAARASGVAERTVREWIDAQLITEQGIRGQVLRQHECTEGLANEAVGELVRSHLVRAEERRGATWFELAHDRLIEPVRTDNRKWLEEHLSTLERRAALWDQEKRSQDMLLKGEELVAAERWAAEQTELPEVEQAFLAASREARAEAERKRRQARQLSRRLKVAIVGFTVAVLCSVFAVTQLFQARRQARISMSQSLAAQARNHLDDKPDLALLLNVEATRIEETVEARRSLLTSLDRNSRLKAVLGRLGENLVLAFSPDGTRLAAAHDKVVTLWDVGEVRQLGEPLESSGEVTAVAFSPEPSLLATASRDGKVVLWNVETREPAPLEDHECDVLKVAFSHDGKRLVSGDERGRVIVWDVRSASKIAEPVDTPPKLAVVSLAISPDGRRLAASNEGKKDVYLWDVGTSPAEDAAMSHDEPILNVAFNRDGTRLLAGSRDGVVVEWDVVAGSPRQTWESSGDEVSSTVFSADGQRWASLRRDGVFLWNEELLEASSLRSVAISPDGRLLATGSRSGTLLLWDLERRAVLRQRHRGQAVISSLALSPDGRLMVSGHQGHLLLWNGSERRRLDLPGRRRPVSSVAFGPDGRFLAAAKAESLVLWKTDEAGHPDARHLATVQAEVHVESVAFSPDGKLLASGSENDTVQLWNVEREELEEAGDPLEAGRFGDVHSVAFSPDGRILASGRTDETIVLWDVAARRQLGEPLESLAGPVRSVAFSPDGRFLASAHQEGSVILWGVGGKPPSGTPLKGHVKDVRSVAFSADSRLLASGDRDGTVVLWDVATKQKLHRFREDSAVKALTFSRGDRMAAAWNDTVSFWETGLGAWQSHACEIANRNLTPEEWKQFVGDVITRRKTCADRGVASRPEHPAALIDRSSS